MHKYTLKNNLNLLRFQGSLASPHTKRLGIDDVTFDVTQKP